MFLLFLTVFFALSSSSCPLLSFALNVSIFYTGIVVADVAVDVAIDLACGMADVEEAELSGKCNCSDCFDGADLNFGGGLSTSDEDGFVELLLGF